MKVVLSGKQAKLYVNGIYRHQYSYSAAFTGGKIGFRAVSANTYFDNFMVSTAETSRTTYTLGGQAIATRVTGDPTAANNGLFYIFSDHLGSTSALAYGSGGQAGQKVPGSKASYYPFGSPRATPTQTITDRNFTGQKENLELGLIYYNARFYLPAIARFLTPDTLIPDPQSPQSFNRYTYTLNNPTRFTDLSGHCVEAFSGASREDNLNSDDGTCWSIYYSWLDKGYVGLDSTWDYVRNDLWLVEELYLQYGVSFSSIWFHEWSIEQVTYNQQEGLRCYGLSCSVSYQKVLISSGGGYLTLKMDGATAWLFKSFIYVFDPVGNEVMSPQIAIGTDNNNVIKEAMQSYGAAYTNYWNAYNSMLLSLAGLGASAASMVTPNLISALGLVLSSASLQSSIQTMNTTYVAQLNYLSQIYNQMNALQVYPTYFP